MGSNLRDALDEASHCVFAGDRADSEADGTRYLCGDRTDARGLGFLE